MYHSVMGRITVAGAVIEYWSLMPGTVPSSTHRTLCRLGRGTHHLQESEAPAPYEKVRAASPNENSFMA